MVYGDKHGNSARNEAQKITERIRDPMLYRIQTKSDDYGMLQT